VLADRVGLDLAQFSGQVGLQHCEHVAVVHVLPGLLGDELLLEAQAGAVDERFDGALGDLHDAGDLPVAESLQLAQGQDQPVLLGKPLGDVEDLAA